MSKPTTPTTAQKKAAALVRSYLRSTRLIKEVDEDEVEDDGVIRIELSHRDASDVDNKEPSRDVKDQFKAHVTKLRELSPLVFVAQEHVDEWVHLTIRVRPTKRKPRPQLIPKLDAKILDRMPQSIAQHPRVTALMLNSRCPLRGLGKVEVSTDVDSNHGDQRLVSVLQWDLRGDTVAGWDLVVSWGCHRIRRPATFKKLVPKIILSQLQKILDHLDDPLDCLGHTIRLKKDGGWIWPLDGVAHEVFEEREVLVRDDKTVLAPYGAQKVVVINNLTGATTELSPGDEYPQHLRALNLR